MNKKFLSFLSKVAIILAILIMCTYNTASAFSFGFNKVGTGSTSIIGSLIGYLTTTTKKKKVYKT